MTREPMTDERKQEIRKRAEAELYEELGFSFKRQNSHLTVIIFGPPTKVESLSPDGREYTAHFLMDKAWDKLVELRVEVGRIPALLKEIDRLEAENKRLTARVEKLEKR